ncbi:hypothetical protein HDU82_002077 [Entophlyctis luteolus]|nr:hypothetical protein HDU82_002077 [Entophlyctis luteolus]
MSDSSSSCTNWISACLSGTCLLSANFCNYDCSSVCQPTALIVPTACSAIYPTSISCQLACATCQAQPGASHSIECNGTEALTSTQAVTSNSMTTAIEAAVAVNNATAVCYTMLANGTTVSNFSISLASLNPNALPVMSSNGTLLYENSSTTKTNSVTATTATLPSTAQTVKTTVLQSGEGRRARWTLTGAVLVGVGYLINQ